MIGYRFLLPAEEEMTEASLFYDTASSGLGAGFLDEVGHLVRLLCEHPNSGQPISGGLRRVHLHRFPFTLIYSVQQDTILIVAVAHQRRRPGYWNRRI